MRARYASPRQNGAGIRRAEKESLNKKTASVGGFKSARGARLLLAAERLIAKKSPGEERVYIYTQADQRYRPEVLGDFSKN